MLGLTGDPAVDVVPRVLAQASTINATPFMVHLRPSNGHTSRPNAYDSTVHSALAATRIAIRQGFVISTVVEEASKWKRSEGAPTSRLAPSQRL